MTADPRNATLTELRNAFASAGTLVAAAKAMADPPILSAATGSSESSFKNEDAFALVDRLQAAEKRRYGVLRWRTHIQTPDGRGTRCGQHIGEHDQVHWTRWSTTWTLEQLGRLRSQWPLCKRCFGRVRA